jgi:hypothetical protein
MSAEKIMHLFSSKTKVNSLLFAKKKQQDVDHPQTYSAIDPVLRIPGP